MGNTMEPRGLGQNVYFYDSKTLCLTGSGTPIRHRLQSFMGPDRLIRPFLLKTGFPLE